MADYKNMYLKLFGAVTDAVNILQKAQAETEEMYMDQDEANVIRLTEPEDME